MKHPDAETTIKVPEEYRPLLEDLRELIKDGENPNHMSKRAREGLWKSMQKYGWIYPILVDQKGMLGDGEQRLETCLAHNEHHGPVLRLDIDDVDRRLLRQITNKLRGIHDPDKDLLEYRRLIEGGRRKELISILQLNEKAIQEALKDKIKKEAYKIPPLDEVETDIKLGDCFKLGNHRLMCGDTTKGEDIDKLMNNEKAEMIMTSPPYWVGKDYETQKNEAEIEVFIEDSTKNIANIMALNNRRIVINTGTGALHRVEKNVPVEEILLLDKWIAALKKAEWTCRHIRIWVKRGSLPATAPHPDMIDHKWEFIATFYQPQIKYTGQNYVQEGWALQGIWDDIPGARSTKGHGAAYPVELPKRNILLYSEIHNIILDPFAGSGSTLIACEQLDRKGYMMEIDPRYCQIIIDRWESYTGEKAAKIEVTTDD